MSLNPSQVQAILSLLSEDNSEIVAGVRKKLAEMGKDAVQEVLGAAGAGTQAQREVGRLLHQLKEPPLEEQFRTLPVGPDGDIDLEEGAFILAKFGYPGIDLRHYRARLDRMASHLAPNIAPDDHPLRIIHTLNHYLFETQGFGEPHTNPDPDNSYLNRVVDRKGGLPIALSAIYILLARRLELPVVGINMPDHFIVKYQGGSEQGILIDPFHRGQILTPNECGEMIGQPVTDELLPEATDREILARMMVNLINIYAGLGNRRRAEALLKFIHILQVE
jgi:regulator of sirC expression with transglutaminase-like and TPR domain